MDRAINNIVGTNLKNIRQERNISLQEISNNCNVTKSFLSQVEKGKSMPSLSTLKSISEYLNITIGSLLGEERVKLNPVVKMKQRKKIEYSNGITMFLLTSPDPNKQMEPLLFELNPEANTGTRKYKHFGQEFVLVIRGILEITLNDQKYILKKGDSIYFNSFLPHSFKNIDKEVTEAIWVDTPPSF